MEGSFVNLLQITLQRNPDWVEKGLMDFHAILEVPKGLKHARFGHLPEVESFAKSEKERRLIALSRTLRLTGSPYVLPPGTPKDRVEIVQEAMRKTFKDSEFHREYRKVVGDDASPMTPEELAKAIRDTPRDAGVNRIVQGFLRPDERRVFQQNQSRALTPMASLSFFR